MLPWPIYKKWMLCLVFTLVVLGIATPVLADYLGPDRTVTKTVSVCKVILYECQFVAAKGDYRYHKVDSWSCSNESKPWKDYSSQPSGCFEGSNDQYWEQEETSQETTVTYPPATISDSLQNCTSQNGWCASAAELFLSGTEPVSGYSILAIEGTLNGQTFACPSASCNVPLNEGDNNFTYWALSSWGDSSTMGSYSAKMDTVSPDVSLSVSGASGTNGWYTSPTTVTAIGTDTTSGLASALLSVDSGSSQSSATLNEGVHTVAVTASDNAGNVSNSSATIFVDTTTPAIDLSINGTTGKNGWYQSNIQVTAIASDATSGVGMFETSADGNAYQAYTTPVSFAEGKHTVQFRATDNAGNSTETPVQVLYVDTVPPVIELPASWELGKNVPYSVQDHGSGLATLRLVIEDEDERYAKVAWNETVSGAFYSQDIDWNGQFKDKTVAPPGTYLVWIKASDQAGNERIKLGKVIVPEPNVFINLLPSNDSLEENLLPPEDLSDSSDTSSVVPPNLNFGSATAETKEPATQSVFLTSGTTGSIPSTSSNILWGAAASAMVGAATAYALEERRKREEAIAARLAQEAQEEERREKKQARKMEKLETQWAQERAWEEARQKEEQQRRGEEARKQREEDRVERKEILFDQEMKAYSEKPHEWKSSSDAYISERNQKLRAELTANYNATRPNDTPVSIPPKKTWWQKSIEWIDNHQAEIAIGIGVVVGVGAIILSGGAATPLVAAAWIAGSAAVAGGAVALGTVGLNAYFKRPLETNVWRNVKLSAGAAAVTTGIGLALAGGGVQQLLYRGGNAVAGYCLGHPTICGRAEWVLNAIDKGEEAGLLVKGTIQTWRGDAAGARETMLELQTEYLDGGMPGNTMAKEIRDELAKLGPDALEIAETYGDDAISLILKYGDDGVDIIGAYGDEGIAILQNYGVEAIDLIKDHGTPAINVMKAVNPEAARKLLETLDDDVLEHAIQQGPDAVAALSGWSVKELNEHGAELALRSKKDAKVLADIRKLIASRPIDPKHLTAEQQELINAIAANSTQYADEGQVVLGKWVDISNGFVEYAQDTGSVHYNPHPDMWKLLGDLGKENRGDVAWLINQQVVQTAIEKGLPFEYTLSGIPADVINNEHAAIQAVFSGETDVEIMRALESDYLPIRMKELQALQKAGYKLTFDEVTNSYVLILP